MIRVGEFYLNELDPFAHQTLEAALRVVKITCPAHGDVQSARMVLAAAGPRCPIGSTHPGVMVLRCPHCRAGVDVHLMKCELPAGTMGAAVADLPMRPKP